MGITGSLDSIIQKFVRVNNLLSEPRPILEQLGNHWRKQFYTAPEGKTGNLIRAFTVEPEIRLTQTGGEVGIGNIKALGLPTNTPPRGLIKAFLAQDKGYRDYDALQDYRKEHQDYLKERQRQKLDNRRADITLKKQEKEARRSESKTEKGIKPKETRESRRLQGIEKLKEFIKTQEQLSILEKENYLKQIEKMKLAIEAGPAGYKFVEQERRRIVYRIRKREQPKRRRTKELRIEVSEHKETVRKRISLEQAKEVPGIDLSEILERARKGMLSYTELYAHSEQVDTLSKLVKNRIEKYGNVEKALKIRDTLDRASEELDDLLNKYKKQADEESRTERIKRIEREEEADKARKRIKENEYDLIKRGRLRIIKIPKRKE